MNETLIIFVIIGAIISFIIWHTIIEDATKSKATAIKLTAIILLLMETAKKQGVSDEVLKQIESTLPVDKKKKK
jgi:type III secretory pathway component EscS